MHILYLYIMYPSLYLSPPPPPREKRGGSVLYNQPLSGPPVGITQSQAKEGPELGTRHNYSCVKSTLFSKAKK